jgi:hypothetical protein
MFVLGKQMGKANRTPNKNFDSPSTAVATSSDWKGNKGPPENDSEDGNSRNPVRVTEPTD